MTKTKSEPKQTRNELRARIECELKRHWFSDSDRAIGRRVHVSNNTVSKYRKRLEEEGEILPRLKSAHDAAACLHEVCTSAISPSPWNDIYDPIDPKDPSFRALCKSIREHGIREPIGVTADGVIISGHRRHEAARRLKVPKIRVLVHPNVTSSDHQFYKLLVNCNTQRTKTTGEVLREEIVKDNSSPRQAVQEYRTEISELAGIKTVKLGPPKRRPNIVHKRTLADAIVNIVMDNRSEWPLNDRRIFYMLLNIEGLVRNDRTKTPFLNNENCYDDVTDLVTRLTTNEKRIPEDAITDETRPVIQWNTHRSVGPFIRKELEGLFSNYSRNLQQSQPNHIEMFVEKNTVASVLRRIASRYRLPMTSGRGYSSTPPRRGMVNRYLKSGKENLVIICVSDFDPEGENIPSVLGRSIRDDFGVPHRNIAVIKSALTSEQVQSLDNLHEGQLAKEDSSRYKQFVEEHGKRCWELEALDPNVLRELVESTIRKIVDLDLFEIEVEKEKEERRELDEHKYKALEELRYLYEQ